MPRKSEATIGRLLTITPAELPPMASSRGSFSSRQLQHGHDLLVVISRVGLVARVPLHLLGEDRLAVDHRRDLDIRSAQVEADPAAIQVAAQAIAGSPSPPALRSGLQLTIVKGFW